MKKEGSNLNPTVRQWCIFVVSMIVIIIVYFCGKIVLERNFVIIEDDFSWVYQIDSIDQAKDKLILRGWAFEQKKDAELGEYKIILYDSKNSKIYYPKMEYESRVDVNAYFSCEYNYTDSGFVGILLVNEEELENKIYEVLLKVDGRRSAISTGIFYVNGEMMFTNPNEFIPLSVEGTDLEKIVKEGVLRVYRSDFGIYVYQYGNELYWIAEAGYGFVNDDTLIQFQMLTTQEENLPAERLENGYNWSNLGFWFKSKEQLEWNTGIYRVSSCALPTDYSVTKIWTGNYISDWIWRQNFRPWYDFSLEK